MVNNYQSEYTTKPSSYPWQVFPDFQDDKLFMTTTLIWYCRIMTERLAPGLKKLQWIRYASKFLSSFIFLLRDRKSITKPILTNGRNSHVIWRFHGPLDSHLTGRTMFGQNLSLHFHNYIHKFFKAATPTVMVHSHTCKKTFIYGLQHVENYYCTWEYTRPAYLLKSASVIDLI